MTRVFLIDDDRQSLVAITQGLKSKGLEVTAVTSGTTSIEAADRVAPEVPVIELTLPDIAGRDILRELRSLGVRSACIIVMRFVACETAVGAMRIGAREYLHKERVANELIGEPPVIARPGVSGSSGTEAAKDEVEPHSIRRWATLVLRTVPLQRDPRTLREWGRALGISGGALRNWCRTAGLPARRSLLFARVLRAVVRQHGGFSAPEDLLDVVDRRTLVKILATSGSPTGRLAGTVEEFLDNQRLIEDRRAVAAIRAALAQETAHLGPNATGVPTAAETLR